MSSETYHEAAELLSDDTKDMHRALVSLGEELQAVDWYGQRAEACTNDELRAVLDHNKNEEIEHATMVLEWIRRQSPAFARNLAKYVPSVGSIVAVEAGAAGIEAARAGPAAPGAGSLGIGGLKGAR
jgi:ferritin-like protein